MILDYEYAGSELRKGEVGRGIKGPSHIVVAETRQLEAARKSTLEGEAR